MKRIVIKIGTNVLTRPDGKLDYNLIDSITEQIADLHHHSCKIALVSSGAVASGKSIVDFKAEKDLTVVRQMQASIGQGRLYQTYSDFFNREHGIITAQMLYTRHDFRNEASFRSIQNTLEALLKHKIVPIANENDAVFSQEGTFGDNDQLSALTAALLSADLLLILSDVDGLYTADPKETPEARLIETVESLSEEIQGYCAESASAQGTGGMKNKLQAAEIATTHGISTVLAGGKRENVIRDIVQYGRAIGTHFLPQQKKSGLKATWLRTSAEIESALIIDDGAAAALRQNKSLLAVGIVGVQGVFSKDTPVFIENERTGKLGVGIARLDSDSLSKKITLGQTHSQVVVHKDRLYLF